MNNLDIILSVILGFGLVRGFLKGFIWELASLVSVVLGIYGAIHFSFYIFDFLKETLHYNISWNNCKISYKNSRKSRIRLTK